MKARIAQLVEQLAFNQLVLGSSPSPRTSFTTLETRRFQVFLGLGPTGIFRRSASFRIAPRIQGVNATTRVSMPLLWQACADHRRVVRRAKASILDLWRGLIEPAFEFFK